MQPCAARTVCDRPFGSSIPKGRRHKTTWPAVVTPHGRSTKFGDGIWEFGRLYHATEPKPLGKMTCRALSREYNRRWHGNGSGDTRWSCRPCTRRVAGIRFCLFHE